MVRWPDEAAHHLRVYELKFARYDVFDWLFNASDIGVIVVFVFRGVVAMWKADGAE